MSKVVRVPLPILRSAEHFEYASFEIATLRSTVGKVPIPIMSELLGEDSVALAMGLRGGLRANELEAAVERSNWFEGQTIDVTAYTTELWSSTKWHDDLYSVLHLQGRVYGAKERSVQAALVGGIENEEFEDWRREFCIDPPLDFIIEEALAGEEGDEHQEVAKIIYQGVVRPGEGLLIGGQGLSPFMDEAVAVGHCFGGAGDWAVLYSSEEM